MEYGYFDDVKKEYVITNMFPRRPWMNYIWNEKYIIDIDQFGFGFGRPEDAKGYKRNMFGESDNRHIFIRDKKTGEYYSANRNYKNLPFKEWYTRVGQGYSIIVSEYNGIRMEYKIFVPVRGMLECWEVKLTNTGSEDRDLSVYAYANLNSKITGHTAYAQIDYEEKLEGLFIGEEGFLEPTDYIWEYFVSEDKPVAYETMRRGFRGTYGSITEPEALEHNEGKLTNLGSYFELDHDAVLQLDAVIKAGEEKTFRYIVGSAKNMDEAIYEKNEYLSEAGFKKAFDEVIATTSAFDNKINIKTPDVEIDRRVNIWLKRQIDLGKTRARVDQKGFRDVMQDVQSFIPLDPKTAKAKILNAMQYVRPNGNALRHWDPISEEVYHDNSSWMITTVAQYIKETDDYSILDEVRPYFDCDEEGTVLDHLMRAISFLQYTTGEWGLTLWGTGDWNDSLNNCGTKGIGESVWLTEATIKVSYELAELLERLGKNEDAKKIIARAEEMKGNILKYAWDKDHFIYGINDYREKVGAYECEEGKIYLNPQTWAILADIVDEDKQNELLDFVEKELSCKFGYVQNKPSYSKGDDHIGRVTYMKPGCYENGSVYNHGCAFKIVADCKLGRGDSALKDIKMMLPDNPDNDYKYSGVEPYAISNMYLGPENKYRAGEAVLHWMTGTSPWLFRSVVEYMLGVQADYDGLAMRPVMPSAWNTASVHRVFRNAEYDITINNNKPNGKITVNVDGNDIEGNIIKPFDDGKTHTVIVNID